jgi:large subunit ribosomal protein L28
MYIPEVDKWVDLKISTSAMRNINKIGLYEYLKRQQKAGFDVGVELTK